MTRSTGRLGLALLLSAAAAFAEDPPAPPKPTEADARAKIEAYNTGVKNKSEEEKQAAIDAMADCPHTMVITKLSQILAADTDACRSSAAKTLGRMKDDPNAAAALHAGIKPNDAKAKILADVFEAIGNVNHPSSVAVCREFVDHRLGARDREDLPGVDSAIDAMGALKWKSSVEALIDLWHKNRVVGRDPASNFKEKVRKWCNQALRRLTGEKNDNQAAWDDWWKDNKAKFNNDLTAK